jgi:outer membrane protein assembly factor BamB
MKRTVIKSRLSNLARNGVALACILVVILWAVAICFFPGAIARAGEGQDWSQFQRDETRSGVTTDTVPTTAPSLNWYRYTWNSGSVGLEVPAVLADGIAYVHAGNGLWAFKAITGETVWQQTVTGSATLQTSTPAYGDGKLFIATFDGYIRAYDALTGASLWEREISNVILQCPITYYDGRIYFGQGGTGGDFNSYFCLDGDGNTIWEYSSETVGYLWSGASIIGDFIVFANHDAVLTSLNRHSGQFVDSLDLYSLEADAGKARASVSYHDGFVYTTSESGMYSGYIWKIGFDGASGQFLPAAGWHNPIGFSTSTPVVHNGRVFVGEGEHGATGSLICLNDADGEILWQYDVPGGVKSSPALSLQGGEEYIYFHTSMNDGNIYCLRGDGTLAWQWDPPGDSAYILQGVSLGYGQVFLGTCSGCLYCLDDGSRPWDINKDGLVDVSDLVITGGLFGGSGEPGWLRQDINDDGVIDVADLVIIGSHWED